MEQTFTDFKNDFYKRVPDLTLFDCGDINLLKVVLDGLKVNYVGKGKVRSYLFYNYYLFLFINSIKRLKNGKKVFKINTETDTLVIDNGRSIINENNQAVSLYFQTILSCFLQQENKVLHLCEKRTNFHFDFYTGDIENYFSVMKLNLEQKKTRKLLLQTFSNIYNTNIFTNIELNNIKFAFHKFFMQYVAFDYFFKNTPNATKCFLLCHYHKEGLIYALRNNKIKCIELQHGLIARQDIFYMFPENIIPIKNKCLFADKIMVFGQFWKQLLIRGFEYNENQIETIGYYLSDRNIEFDAEVSKLNYKNTNFILITTQTYLHNDFINFTKILLSFIKNNKLNYQVILKPHPAEDISIYSTAFLNNEQITIINKPLPVLFLVAKYHISIYSTTLFDALRYNVVNYVFKTKQTEDYVNEILSNNIASEILNFDFLLETRQKAPQLNSSFYYEDFNLNTLINE